MTRNATVLYVMLYLTTIVAANLLVAALGMWIAPVLSLVFIGLDMALRDHLHNRWERRGKLWPRMLSLVVAGSILSAAIQPASWSIAVASGISFALAGILDAGVYAALHRHNMLVKANGSNLLSAVVESATFLYLAVGYVDSVLLSTMWCMKVCGGFIASSILHRIQQRSKFHVDRTEEVRV